MTTTEPNTGALDLDPVERDLRLQSARVALGITGSAGGSAPVRLAAGIKASGVGWYPLLALSLLVIVDELQGYAFGVLGPEIAATLGLSKSSLAMVVTVKTIAISFAMLPLARVVQNKPRRGVVSVVAAFAWAALTGLTGLVTVLPILVLVMVADGVSTGTVRTVHTPLLMDSYPPELRVRGLSFYKAADGFGAILGPVVVAVMTGIYRYSWRGVFVGLAVLCVLPAVFSIRLRDPGFGRWDTDRARAAVRGVDPSAVDHDDAVDLRFFEIVRRLLAIRTVRRVLLGNVVMGMLTLPLVTYLYFFLDEEWGMGATDRSIFSAVLPIFSLTALAVFGRKGEALFRKDPGRVLRLAGTMISLAVLMLGAAVLAPFFALMVLCFGVAFSLVAALGPALGITMLSVIPPAMRPHAAAIQGIALAAVGGIPGILLLGGLDSRFGSRVAIAALTVPGIAAGLILRSAASTVNDDIDQLLEDIVDEEHLDDLVSKGHKLPLLACRRINFSYGEVQVLFDVDFSIDEGEMVALLGTNGAGKSTLLKVISGLALPSRGSVRLAGRPITFLDAERRLPLGISQVPGGQGVFGELTVADNLRAFGFMHGRNRAAVENGIDIGFDTFPRLAERRDQMASTLSGGEQQMLALSSSFITRPQLLLIDELSLGLAPIIVGQLLEMVREINNQGTSVVLVEQSVNVALTLATHAYFMEKGEIRFDGRADELLERTDLLRAVFLGSAASAFEKPET